MKAARRHQIHENLGVPTGGRGTQGRGTRQMLRIHQCMYSCLIWRMIRLWLEERLKPRTRASSQGKFVLSHLMMAGVAISVMFPLRGVAIIHIPVMHSGQEVVATLEDPSSLVF